MFASCILYVLWSDSISDEEEVRNKFFPGVDKDVYLICYRYGNRVDCIVW